MPSKATGHLFASVGTGVFIAGAFNPWDRALYLSVKEHKPFLSRANFDRPYEGFSQAVLQRTVSGGLYFFLQGVCGDVADDVVGHALSPTTKALVVGSSAGVLNGMALNQLATVKYYIWGHAESPNFWQAAREMYRHGGFKHFYKGIWATGLRDGVFGIVYEVIRLDLRCRLRRDHSKRHYLVADMMAGAAATVISGPLNYARNIQYATPLGKHAPSIFSCLRYLVRRAFQQRSGLAAASYLQERLRIGWGSLRVAVGMALGQYVYDLIDQRFSG